MSNDKNVPDVPDVPSIRQAMEHNKGGNIAATVDNFRLAFAKDSFLADCVGYNLFDNRLVRRKLFPWNDKVLGEVAPWRDIDDCCIRNYLESNYSLRGIDLYNRVLNEHSRNHAFHPVRDYLLGLPEWDRMHRAEELLIDKLKADDTPYVRAVTRHWLLAAVSRVFHPGCKWDYCLVIKGIQGCGKSTMFRKLAGPWFNDSINALDGKDVMEQLQGSWIVELSELQATNKSDNEQIKSFLSRQVDKFRAPYGKRTEEHPRQCVFAGTTNAEEFLRDRTGSRRFLIVTSNARPDSECDDVKDTFKWRLGGFTDSYRDEIWSEVMYWYKGLFGFDGSKFNEAKLDLPSDIKAMASEVQNQYTEGGELEAEVLRFLSTRIPKEEDWCKLNKVNRRAYMQTGYVFNGTVKLEGVRLRDKVCSAEILYEGMGIDNYVERRMLIKQVNEILSSQSDWIRNGRGLTFPQYGRQKVSFSRARSAPGHTEV